MTECEFIQKLYISTSGKLMKYLMCMCRDRQLAEDVLQETYFEAFLNVECLKKHSNVTAWLYKTSSYKMLNALKKQEKRNVSIDVLVEKNLEPSGEDRSLTNHECQIILETVLSSSERNLIWNHYMLGYSWREISVMNEVSEGALRTQMSRIKRKLCEELRKSI